MMDKQEIETIVRQVLAAAGQSGEAPAGRDFFPEAGGADEAKNGPAQMSVAEPGIGGGPARRAENGSRGRAGSGAVLTAANGGMVHTAMPLALAVKLIGQIEAKAAEWDMRVVTAVSDASGRPVAVHCMDGAYLGSFDVALNKTYTSIAFQMSTALLGELAQPGQSLYGIQFTNEGRIVIFGGGEVLKRGEEIVGALGVSGGSAAQDTELAAYGKKIFEEVAKCL